MKESTGIKQINFGSGPAALPDEVLREAGEAIIDYKGTGLSILEILHRGKLFNDILEESKVHVKDLCALNDDYEILWLHGGGRLQFCMVPMNFLGDQETAGYIDSGHWSQEAIKYAAYYGTSVVLASSREDNYNRLPDFPSGIPTHYSYLHLTTNNTIYGTQWNTIPVANIPLIADMSSDIFSRQRPYTDCSLFYAVAQKNIGAAGTTLVVIRKDMLQRIKRHLPPMLDYNAQVEKKSVLNTPPVFAIYTALLMLRWTKTKGIEAIERENHQKASMVYSELERNSLFNPTVSIKEHRSLMNVCFTANNPEIEKGFSEFCSQNNITGLEGHRTVGGFRVSLYNAITLAQAGKLVAVMQEFETINIKHKN